MGKKPAVKKIHLISLILVMQLLISGSDACAQADSSLDYTKKGIPVLKLLRVPDSTQLTNLDLKKNTSTLLVIFNAGCELCEYEINDIKANIGLFKKTQVIFTSPQDFELLKAFYEKLGLQAYPGITMARDPGYTLGAWFKNRAFPSMFLYNKTGKFVKKFNGSETIREIANAL